MTDIPRIRLHHIREAKLCMAGTRHWFREHGLSWDQLLEEGIPVDVAEAFGDPFAQQLADLARRDAE